MLAFLVRRLIGALLVLIAVSFITYLIFIKIPGGDPAQRIAGRTATDANIADIRAKLHLDDPFYVQYWGMMQSLFNGSLKSYASQLNVVNQERDSGDAVALYRRRNHLAQLRDPRRCDLGRHRGAGVGPVNHRVSSGRNLAAGVLARADCPLPLRTRPSVRDPAGR
jgi:hypothetical protein